MWNKIFKHESFILRLFNYFASTALKNHLNFQNKPLIRYILVIFKIKTVNFCENFSQSMNKN